MYYNAALVLEGGGMRGNYTAGVLDAFIANDIQFKCVIGVSAGALAGVNFVSKQFRRTFEINRRYSKDKDYISFSRLLRKENFFNLEFLFADHGFEWHNFDERAYLRSETNFIPVATRLNDGKMVYFEKPIGQELEDALCASATLPFIAKPYQTSQGLCMDGGFSDSIPYDLAQKLGFNKIVVVRTQERSYRKKPTSRVMKELYLHEFKEYPDFAKAAITRPQVYNRSLNILDGLEELGEVYCIAPQEEVKVGRLERNPERISELYHVGFDDAIKAQSEMLTYLR
ncbi:patatin-like phospholipase family protein [Ligilactobacillus equi]|uniref:Esterase of the alpha-beta hydrolase superfamily n=1 Tax=Ligilactobacillus equi DSM 15833 = JCM 10991 TaxID=1423740 RepID=A0A0R1TX03_9LACO|nr:patatin family protein [Ligilactobacillus equi]KRL83299.1 esterase of the alpha-beta hydrolase superfamily [Ligilactobacillus equi DSM 15833 = JCM 10991]